MVGSIHKGIVSGLGNLVPGPAIHQTLGIRPNMPSASSEIAVRVDTNSQNKPYKPAQEGLEYNEPCLIMDNHQPLTMELLFVRQMKSTYHKAKVAGPKEG